MRGFVRYLVYGSSIAQFIAFHSPKLITLELCPGICMIAGDIVRRTGIPYVVFPQNLEFLVPNPKSDSTFRDFSAAYEVESLIYRSAQKVCAISEFDATILKCMAVEASVWPAYPSSSDLVRLERIRETRLNNPARRNEVLVIGTVENPPTFAGMCKLLEAVRTSQSWMSPITVVGFGTQQLGSADSRVVNILGSVSNEALDDLMVRCAFALIYQPPTTGFMTRLLELNLAGIPVAVLGGYQQAMTLRAFGVRSFDDLERIDAALMTRTESRPVPAPPIEHLLSVLSPMIERASAPQVA